MNMFAAYEKRDQLNLKMLTMLLCSLKDDLIKYYKTIENYSPEQMQQYGQPFLDLIEIKIKNVEELIRNKNSG